jgi:hypothetical protein
VFVGRAGTTDPPAEDTMHRRWIIGIVAALIVLVVLPHQWLAEQWSIFAGVFNPFCLRVGHTVGHLLVFAVLAAALVVLVPAFRRRPWLLLPVALAIGLGQEFVQLIYKQRLPGGDEIHDLTMDLIAAGVVAGVVTWVQGPKRRGLRG